ncbi:MAG: MBL fold metallo-hydrolase [candidate division WOR-3 bacterium]
MKTESQVPTIVRLQLGAMRTNCYLLADSGEVAVIDPGFEPDRILAAVDRLPAPAQVKLVLNTHGHIDHIGANAEIIRATGARLLIGRQDAAMLSDAQGNLSVFLGQGIVSPPPDRLLDEGDTIDVGRTVLTVWATPGHTEGGICLIGDGFAFTGDTLFFDSMGRTDFPGGSDRKMQASLERLVRSLPDESMIYPGHKDPGRMGDIKRVNMFLDFARW